ncbi:DUF4389 domain-containing protein [Nocardioides daeguensis]|nr:DUF4389 domain-containing protein [Nocardioides daeguensis]MBV6728470.1 DUF4389 domain-containing protein [Nocardioides daeguensis]MCR1773894.1 DUF4389 domain-containing protein [Nocardioides daeguensis]
MSSPRCPARLDASLQPRLSRWLWLVKWLLAIPHFVVLAFLWLAFLVLSVVALVAIVVTGRYPRAAFDFNVGVLRWTWRVAYYAYGGLGTDQYPPFTLAERADDAAHLDVDYPERLSRGLALVKWWLLAIPHYVVVGFFLGGGWYVVSGSDDDRRMGAWGLIQVLVLIAGVALLFTGRYPRGIHDLVVGLNRWVLRVTAYACLMTDQYPPFRLDLGGSEPDPGGALAPEPGRVPSPPPAAPPTAPPSAPRGWGAGRVVAVVAACLALLAALGLIAAGTTALVVDRSARDADGYLTTSAIHLRAPGHALVSEDLEIEGAGAAVELPERLVGDVRVSARLDDGEVFIGIAESDAAAAYLAGVGHSSVTGPVDGEDGPVYDVTAGGPPSVLPEKAGIWRESAAGSRRQQVTFTPREGSWTVVVMRADGAAPVEPSVTAGATLPVLDDLAAGLLVGGLVLLAGGGVALLLALRRP